MPEKFAALTMTIIMNSRPSMRVTEQRSCDQYWACAVLPGPLLRRSDRLVTLHEVGGDSRSDLLRDADCISFFDVNLPLYYQREGWDESMRSCIWGYRRLSVRLKKITKRITYEDETLTRLLKMAIQQA